MEKQQNAPVPTILRIKRRRRDEHETLDALVFERAKPSKRAKGDGDDHPGRPTQGIFRFAETVPATTFSDESSKRSLRDRITSLLQHPPPRSSSRSSKPDNTNGGNSSPRYSKFTAPDSPSSTSKAQAKSDAARKQARYKIIEQKRSTSALSLPSLPLPHTDAPGRRPTAPPVVRTAARSSADSGRARPSSGPVNPSNEDFRILEAAIEHSGSDSDKEDRNDPMRKKLDAYRQSRKKHLQIRRQDKTQSALAKQQEEEVDQMMANFVPMLQEYLSLSNTISTPTKQQQNPRVTRSSASSIPAGDNSSAAPSTPGSTVQDVSPPHPGFSYAPDLSSGDAADSDSEWVYDVYYRDVNVPDTSSASSSAGHTTGISSIAGSTSDLFDLASGEAFKRIGALSGLEEDELISTDQTEEEDSDALNTEDEDSNEEDFYRNDYPEGEGEESDDFIDDSEQDDEDDDSDVSYDDD